MAFTFLRSYQPELEHPEEEEEDEMPMARSGSVRAFSHLPDRAAEGQGTPPPQVIVGRSGGLRPYSPVPAHEEDDGDEGEMPMARSGSVRAFSHLPDSTENAGGVGGYLPPGPAAAPQARGQGEAPDSGFVFHPQAQDDDHDPDSGSMDHPGEGRSIDPGFAAQAPAEWGNRTRDSGFAAQAPAEWGSRTRDSGFEAAGQRPAAGSAGMTGLPKSLLFEKRLPPGFRATGSAQPRSLAGQDELHDLVYRKQGGSSSPLQVQTVAAASQKPSQIKIPLTAPDMSGRKDPLAPSAPKQDKSDDPDPSAPGSKNNAKDQPQKQNPAPPTPAQGAPPPRAEGSQNGPLNITVDGDKNSPFSATVRSAMDREMQNSPASARLLDAAKRLPNKIKIVPKIAGEANTTLQADGTIVISVNPRNMTGATMSHELSHAIQQAGYHNKRAALLKEREAKRATGTPEKELKQDGAIINEAVQAGRDALNGVLPLQNKNDQGQEFKENEAMRAGHIVNAERTAAEIKAKIGDHSSLSPDEIAEMFLREQLKKEDSKHINNGLIIPKGTKYGDYDFAPVLKSLGNGVTLEHLQKARKKLVPNGW
jgi:hypothetical protein